MPIFFCQKNTKPNCKYKKLLETHLYEKAGRKMLVKLTPVVNLDEFYLPPSNKKDSKVFQIYILGRFFFFNRAINTVFSGKKLYDPLEIFHDPSVEKHCSKSLISSVEWPDKWQSYISWKEHKGRRVGEFR